MRRGTVVAVVAAMMLVAAFPMVPFSGLAQRETITLDRPDGGERIMAGETYTISWHVSDGGGYIHVSLSKDSGESWERVGHVANNPKRGIGHYDWFVPPNGDWPSCRIKVDWYDSILPAGKPMAMDSSEADFMVVRDAHVSFVEVPAVVGYGHYNLTTYDLFDPNDMVGKLRFLWRIDEGSGYGSWVDLPGASDAIDPDRGWIWWMPEPYEDADCQLKVEALSVVDNSVLASDETGDIHISSPTVTLLYPAGAVTLVGGRSYTIEWRTSEDPSQTIISMWLRYSTDGGSTWTTIAHDTPNDYQEQWAVPSGQPWTSVIIRVIAFWGEFYKLDDDTSEPLSYVPDANALSVTLVDPNPPVDGGVVIGSGEMYPVRWTATGKTTDIKEFKVYYSTDGGASFTYIGKVAAAGRTYQWTVPAVDTWEGRLKVELVPKVGASRVSVSAHDVYIFDTIAFNRPPVAIVEQDVTGTEGEIIGLNASASYDPDGDPLTVHWTQVEPIVKVAPLSNPNLWTPWIMLELEHYPVELVFEVEVSDGNEHDTSWLWSVDRVTVTVEPKPPKISDYRPDTGWAGTTFRVHGEQLKGAEVLFGNQVVHTVPTQPSAMIPDPDNETTFHVPASVAPGEYSVTVRTLAGEESHYAPVEIFPVPDWQFDNGLGFTNPSKHLLSYPWAPWDEGRYKDTFGDQVYLSIWVCLGIPYWTPWDGWDCLGYLIKEPFMPDPLAAIFYGAFYCWIARGGECFGMSATALRHYHGEIYKSMYEPAGAQNWSDLENGGELREHVDYFQGAQLSSECIHWYLNALINSLVPSSPMSGMGIFLDQVKGAVDSGDLGIVSIMCGEGAHAMVPYAYEDIGSKTRIYVYDPNREQFSNPDSANMAAWSWDDFNDNPPYIEIDRTGTYWEWRFEWDDGTMWNSNVGIAFLPWDILSGDRTLPASLEGLITLLAGSASTTVEDGDGNTMGYNETGDPVWDIEGASPMPFFQGAGDRVNAYVLPEGEYTHHIHGEGDGHYNWSLVSNGTSAFWIEDAEVGEDSEDTVTVTYADGNPLRGTMLYGTSDASKEYTASITHKYGQHARVFRVIGSTVSDDGNHGITTSEDYNSLVFTNHGESPVTFDVEFQTNVVSEEVWNGTSRPVGVPTAFRAGITVGPGETVVVGPTNWTNLDGSLVLLEGEEAPGAPTGLTATPEGGAVSLSWTAPAETGGFPLTGYVLFKGTLDDPPEGISLDAVTSYIDEDVEEGTEYFYSIAAVTTLGEGLRSDVVSVEVPVGTTPSAPSGLTASYEEGHGVRLVWEAPTDVGTGALTGYVVFRGDAADNLTELEALGVVTSYDDDTVEANETYHYTVLAVNAIGRGARAQSAQVTVPADAGGGGDGDDDGGLPWTLLLAAVLAVVIVIGLAYMMMGRRGGPEAMAPAE